MKKITMIRYCNSLHDFVQYKWENKKHQVRLVETGGSFYLIASEVSLFFCALEVCLNLPVFNLFYRDSPCDAYRYDHQIRIDFPVHSN